jgi:hypothetical protein
MPNYRILFEMIVTALNWAPFTACCADIFSLIAREHDYSYPKQNPSSRIIDKPAASQPVNKFLAFCTTLRFFPRSQQPATCPYPELNRVGPSPHSTSWRSISILSSHLCLGHPGGLFLSDLPTKIQHAPVLYHTRTAFRAHLMILDLII